MENQQSNIVKTEYFITGMVLAGLGIIWYLFFTLLLEHFGLLVSIMMHVIGFWFLLRLVVRCMVFPGSTRLWSIMSEAGFCEELSQKLASCIKDIRYHLENLDENAGVYETDYAMDQLEITLKSYMNIESITKKQKALYSLLSELEMALRQSECLVDEKTETNL